jgi:hypothetical protein
VLYISLNCSPGNELPGRKNSNLHLEISENFVVSFPKILKYREI